MKTEKIAPGVLIVPGKRKRVLTKNLVEGHTSYGESTMRIDGVEHRVWDPRKSKLCSGILKGVVSLPAPGSAVLYLGASTGTTVSHVSDIVGEQGIVFAVEFAPRVAREMLALCEERHNIAPILGDATQPDTYADRLCEVDWLFQDIATRLQVKAFLDNVERFLKPGGQCLLAIKARSVDSTKKPEKVFNQVKHELSNSKVVQIIKSTKLEPFQKDHCLFLCERQKE